MTFVASKTLFTVQALRAVAASSVVAYHVLLMLIHNGGYTFPRMRVGAIGACGVDLFFVISGFIMIYTTDGSFGRPRAMPTFLQRRAIRIIPSYWLYSTVLVLLLAFYPNLFSEIKFNWQNVISSYLFLLSKNSNGNIGTVLQTGWTLCFEVYFYLIFALLLNFPRKFFLAVSGCLFMAGYILGTLAWSPPAWGTVAMDPILFEFLIGSIIAFLFLRGFTLSLPLAVAALIIAVITIAMTSDINLGTWARVAFWGLPGGFILLAAISLERAGMNVPRLFVAVGDGSYSIYLVHPFIVPALGKLWMSQNLSARFSPAILFLLAFSCSIAVGYLLYRVIEKPAGRWLSNSWKGPALGDNSIA